MKTSILLGLGLIAYSGAISLPVQASIVQTIPSADGQNQQSRPIPLSLAPGAAITLNFTPAGETITKVWLDNPSFVVIDADGCLNGLPSARNCQGAEANLINLRRINDLSIPGLPKTNHSNLTVITQKNGGTNVYLFRITKASNAKTLVFEIVPNRPPTPVEPLVLTTSRMTRGLKSALEQDLLVEGSDLTQQIHQFISYLESGLSKSEASPKAGLSPAIVNKLESLGR